MIILHELNAVYGNDLSRLEQERGHSDVGRRRRIGYMVNYDECEVSLVSNQGHFSH